MSAISIQSFGAAPFYAFTLFTFSTEKNDLPKTSVMDSDLSHIPAEMWLQIVSGLPLNDLVIELSKRRLSEFLHVTV